MRIVELLLPGGIDSTEYMYSESSGGSRVVEV